MEVKALHQISLFRRCFPKTIVSLIERDQINVTPLLCIRGRK
jgi:hypothetical protein